MDGVVYRDTTKAFYDQNAESYAKSTQQADVHRAWDLLTSRLALGSGILDLGCGAGRDLKYFAERGYRVVGVDYSPQLVEIARNYSGQRVILADFESLSMADASFDAVWAIASLLHVPRNRIEALLEHIHRLLKPQGVFVASMKKGTGERVDEKGRYFVDYEPEEWVRLLKQARFENVQLQEMCETRTKSTGIIQDIAWIVSTCTRK